jgi:D-alanine--D-alanine ligase
MISPSKIRVAVLRGGPSSEYDVSLKTGGYVLKNLPDKYEGVDVLIDRDGLWHIGGLPKTPDKVLNKVDVVFNALHGAYGEDGKVQHILQTHAVPFTGSSPFASALGMNKVFSKELFVKNNIKTPQYTVVRSGENIAERTGSIFKSFLMPLVVKPATSDSSVGLSIVRTIPELHEGIERAFEHSHIALIEEFIPGREATCGVIENFRGQPLYALLPTEIRKKNDGAFDYNAKYIGETEEITPGNFSEKEKRTIEDFAKLAHKVLGLRHYSRSDFIVTPKRGIYILETNSQPGLTEHSLMPKAFSASGIPVSHFLDHVLSLALA